jgi:WD40 repeat protein
MFRFALLVLWLECTAGWVPIIADQTSVVRDNRSQNRSDQQRTDRYGDPLPGGALARLGMATLRHRSEVTSLVFTHDGRTLITGASSNSDEECQTAIRFWDAATGKLVRCFSGLPYGAGSLALSPDEKILAYDSGAAYVCLLDMATGRLLHQLKPEKAPEGNIVSVAFAPDGASVASIGCGSGIHVWEVPSGKLLRHFPEQQFGWALAFSPNGKTLLAGGSRWISLRDSLTGKELWRPRWWDGWRSIEGCHAVAFSPDGTIAAAGCDRGILRLISTATGKEFCTCQGHRRGVRSMAFSPDGKVLASGGEDGSIRFWNAANGREIRRLTGHADRVYAVAFSPDGLTLASGGGDNRVRLWDVTSGKERFVRPGHRNLVRSVTFAPDGEALASAGFDNQIWLWEPLTGKPLGHLSDNQNIVHSIEFSPDGKRLASCCRDGTVLLNEFPSGKEVLRIKGHKDEVYSVAFSADGQTLASASSDGVRILDGATGKELRRLKGGDFEGWTVFSPNGRTLAEARQDNTVRLYEIATGKEVRRLVGHTNDVMAVGFSPDGKTLATGSMDESVRLWEASSGKLLRKLDGHQGAITSVAFSPDGRAVVSGSYDETVRVWEVLTGKEMLRFRGHEGGIFTVAYSPLGRCVASGSWDTTVLVWDVTGLARKKGLTELSLSTDRLHKLWDDLAGSDAARADRALWSLVAANKQSVPFIRDHLQPAPARIEPAEAARLIKSLDSEPFGEREEASRQLALLGESAEPKLRQALKAKSSPERRARVQQLLDTIEANRQQLPPELLRSLRALAVLEWAATPEARLVLEGLTKHDPDARLTREAKATLGRVLQRQPPARTAQ